MITRFWILLGLFTTLSAFGEELKEAKVTAVINEVNLLPNESSSRKATVNDEVRRGTAVRTGVESRSELTFTDKTIARLGANTLFSFEEGTRHMDLGGGAMLLRVPKNAGGAKISTAAVTAAITGTTVMLQYDKNGYAKLAVLEGVACMSANADPGNCVPVKAGQLLTVRVNPPPTSIPAPVDIDLKKLTETSALLSSDFDPLPSLDLISQAVEEQAALKEEDKAAEVNSQKASDQTVLVSFEKVLNAVDQHAAVEGLTSPTPTPTPTATPTPTTTPTPTVPPTPTPAKFVPPQTIVAPVPYIITSNTTIATDPSITTNATTDFGSIYRDQTQDGNFSQWLFGASSEFDVESGFDSEANAAFFTNIAVFKFENLVLSGNPSISTANGGVNRLGLVGVDGLTTGSGGGTFTFGGVDTLLLATQAGSINLGAGYSFQGNNRIFIYARGEGVSLTSAANISANNDVRLYSEGAVNLSGAINTTNFSSFGSGAFTSSSKITAGAIYITEHGSGASFTDGSANAEIFSVAANGDLQLLNPFVLHAVTIDLTSSGNITWSGGIFPAGITNSNASVTASADLALHITGNLEVDRSSGDTNDGMNVTLIGHSSLTVDGNLTTNLTPGLVDTGANTSIISDGTITVAGALSLNTEVRTNMTSGGDILVSAGADSNGNLSAQSIAAKIKADNGVSLGGGANLVFTAGGNLTTSGGAMSFIVDDSVGGKIIGDAKIDLTANNISTNGHAFDLLLNNNAGNITGGAFTTAIAQGNFTAGDTTLQILNSDDGAAGRPGVIAGNALLGLEVDGDFTANSLRALINDRHRGSIGTSAQLELAVLRSMTITNDMTFGISTRNDGSGGGTIGGQVDVNLNASSVNVGGFLDGFISTNGGGAINGNARIDLEITGDLSADGGILVNIADTRFSNVGNLNGGHIGGDAQVFVNAPNILTTSTASGVPGTDTMALEFSIYSNGAGTIGGNASVSVNAPLKISAPGTIFFTVANGNYQNSGPGTIGGNAAIGVNTTDLFSGDLFAEIYNYGGASIGGSANVVLSVARFLHATGDVHLTIDNHGGNMHAALLSLQAGSLSAKSLNATINNANGGQIAADATIQMGINGTAAITNDAIFQIFGTSKPTDAINFSGGSYNVGGTFRSTIDSNGILSFSNTNISADVIKAGVFGSNGTLRIGGGTISANTLLRLYAPGSSGLIEFVANTTLSNASAAIVLAANTVTIDNNVRVTISGPQMALVYTNNANYTGSGGNGTTTGMFIGNAVTHLLSEAPPFDQTNPVQTIVYSGAANGVWSNAAVWNPNVVPNDSNGQTYNASIASGSLAQDIAAGVVIEQLIMSGGTLRLDHPLTLNAGLQFSGGAINSGILNIAGASTQSAQMTASGLTINNSGTYDITLDNNSVFSGGGGSFNNSGTLRKVIGSGTDTFSLPLDNTGAVMVQAGTLRLTGGGTSSSVFSVASGAVLSLANGYTITDGASLNGSGFIQLENNNSTTFSGTINNTGNFRINSAGNFTDLLISGNTTLNGNGTLSLVNAARVRGTGILFSSNLIQGETSNTGSLGNNEIGLANLVTGVIDANVNGLQLNVDPNNSNGLTNAGIMRASNGGLLLLNGNGGGAFDNAGGTITALAASEVQLANGASISGGTLTTSGTGVIRTLNTASLNSLTNAGVFRISNNTSATFSGTINNTGNINVASVGNFTDLFLNGAVTFIGGGAINLQNAARVRGNGTIFNGGANGEAHTIQGETSNTGSLGTNESEIVNRSGGLIDANVNGLALNVDPNSSAGLTNDGLMRASNGGILLLNGNGGGGFQNNAIISALNGSEVQLTNGATITGGTLTTAGTGVFRTLNTGTLVSLTNAGNFLVSNNTSLTLAGTLINTGNLTIASTGNFTDLFINGSVTLTGSGFLNLQNAARIRGSGTLFNGGPNGEVATIQGETSNTGSLGTNELTIVNRSGGLINANVSLNGNGLALVVDPSASGNLSNTGIMRASNGGILQLTGNGGGVFNNSGGVVEALAGSQVQLTNGATVVGGTLQTSGTGVIRNINSATLDSLTNAGSFTANNNTSTTVLGTITNNGTLLINSQGNFTDLLLGSDVTITGSGQLVLQNAARVRSNGAGSFRLTNGASHTISGETSNTGSLGANELAITNNYSINANVNGLSLNVDPSPVGLINNAVMVATNGGILLLNGNGGGSFDNTNGQINGFDTGEVQLTNGASVHGGGLFLLDSSVLRVLNAATLSDVRIQGRVITNNSTTTTLAGSIINDASFTVNSTGNFTDLTLSGNVSLSGFGSINLTNADRVRGSGILANSSTIVGETSNSGSLGTNEIGIENLSSGIIDANVSGKALNVDPSASDGVINQGIMRATNGGILLLNGNGGGSFAQLSGGSVTAFDSSEVQLTNGAAVVGGLWQTQGTGVIRVLNTASLANLSLGANFISNNTTTTTFFGTITNTGNITINSTGNFTDAFMGGVTLTGGGHFFLSNADRIRGSGVLTNVNNLIQGETNNSGSLGTNELGIVNQSAGIIDANVNGLVLNVDPDSTNGLTNAGTMQASNGGILLLNGNGGGDFNNSGTIAAVTGGTLRFNGNVNSSGTVDVGSNTLTATGTYTQSAGTFRLAGGSVQSNNALNFQGGLVDARGTISSAIMNNANLRPALGGSGLQVTGNVSLLSASQLTFQLGGLTQGSQYGFLNVNGNVSLGGQLLVSFVNGFQNSVTNSNSFTVLSSTATLSGVFANVASGSRLTTTDSSGSFLVNYNGNTVVLSDYTSGGFRAAKATTTVTRSLTPPAPARAALQVTNSSELLQVLENAAPTVGGKVVVRQKRVVSSQARMPANASARNGTPSVVRAAPADSSAHAKLFAPTTQVARNER